METEKHNLQFVPLSSIISGTFWESFSKLKLNELQLKTDPIEISSIYCRRVINGVAPLIYIQLKSLSEITLQPGELLSKGLLINANTVEDYKKRNKCDLLNIVASKIWQAIMSGEAEESPEILSSFLIYIYADLKKYHYYYWCAFPAFSYPDSLELASSPKMLQDKIADKNLFENIESAFRNSDADLAYFAVAVDNNINVEVLPLALYYQRLKNKHEKCDIWLGFSDSASTPSHPGWSLRNLLTLAAVRWSDIRTHTVICLREKISGHTSSFAESLMLEIAIRDEWTGEEMPPALGWEKNERGKMGPRFTNMAKTMDPARIAESAVELNLKLMKWRLDPALDLERIKDCRCLLLGAGTLGCNVARCLLGWGVQKITFVDNGRVSYSNPVRQSLYIFEDCVQEGKLKAEAAASSLKKIFPRVDAMGVVLTVPMPGHCVGASQYQQVKDDVSTLERLIDEHDALFLLTDSRESRWLPSLIGAAKQKTVLTAALGFDSYLVMWHGTRPPPTSPQIENKCDSSSFGCYFCNDVVAPGDSMSDRTLDQQCTVTRPGVSHMAAGHIVELLIDILQHPVRLKTSSGHNPSLPHSIRYFLGRMNQLVTSSPPFRNCSACSSYVISEYLEKNIEFLLKVFNSPNYLEDVSGLTKLHEDSQVMEILELSDDNEAEESISS